MDKVSNLILQKTNLDLNVQGELPAGSAEQGITAGSLGYASMADLETGFTAADSFDPEGPSFTSDGEQDTKQTPDITASPFTGFLGRPQGWQR